MKYTGKKEKLIYFWHVSVYMYTLYTLQYSDVESLQKQRGLQLQQTTNGLRFDKAIFFRN